MRVITVSRTFPGYHPKAGQPTYFVEKIWAAMADENLEIKSHQPGSDLDFYKYYKAEPKRHTIRSGDRWKVGDMASLRYWSGRPYHSKQIEFAQVEIKKVFTYEVKDFEQGDKFLINGKLASECNAYMQQWNNVELIKRLAKNDGLEMWDFLNWFKHPKDFIGQIICWSDKVNY